MEARQDESYNIDKNELGKQMFEQLDDETKKEIESKKDEGREIFIYKFENDQVYVFRGVSFLEYKRLKKAPNEKYDEYGLSDEDKYLLSLVETALLYPKLEPKEIVNLTMGEVTNLGEFITYASQFETNSAIYKL